MSQSSGDEYGFEEDGAEREADEQADSDDFTGQVIYERAAANDHQRRETQ